jgi:hypothetical protein
MTLKRAEPYASFNEIKALEDELFRARRSIIRFMPESISNALSDYHSCNSHADFSDWRRRIVDLIISKAEIDPRLSNFEERGWCPLCKGGSRGPYDKGFKIPGGLEKHLFGDGNASQCIVTEAAFRNAMYALHETFEAADRLETQKMEERRRSEQTFLIDPSVLPQLIDEGFFIYRRTRSVGEFASAEERLATLGFQKEVTGNVTAYKSFHEDRLVLADPREHGRIRFKVFNATKPNKGTKTETFDFLDGWTKNLQHRYLTLLLEACGRLPSRK